MNEEQENLNENVVNEDQENLNDDDNEQHDQSWNENDNKEVIQLANMNELNDTHSEDPKQLENEEESKDDEIMIEECCFPLNVDDSWNWDKIDQNIKNFLIEFIYLILENFYEIFF